MKDSPPWFKNMMDEWVARRIMSGLGYSENEIDDHINKVKENRINEYKIGTASPDQAIRE